MMHMGPSFLAIYTVQQQEEKENASRAYAVCSVLDFQQSSNCNYSLGWLRKSFKLDERNTPLFSPYCYAHRLQPALSCSPRCGGRLASRAGALAVP